MTKYCSRCGENKPFSSFNFVRGKPHGYCRICKTAEEKERRRKNGVKEKKVHEITSTHKTCGKCEQMLPHENFSPQKGATGNLCPWCRKCKAEHESERRRKSGVPKKIFTSVDDTHKTCACCMDRKPFSEFSPSKRGTAGLSSYCKPCNRKKFYDKEKGRKSSARYRIRHKERWRASHRLHQFKRRSNVSTTNDGTVTDSVLRDLYSKEICTYCNRKTPEDKRTIDHVIPLSRGGTHSASNLTMACLSCNCSKGAKTAEEFMELNNDNHSKDY